MNLFENNLIINIVDCISQGFTAVNRHYDQGKSYKWHHLIGAGLQVERFSWLSSRQKHGSIQAGVVQEELRILHLYQGSQEQTEHPQASRRKISKSISPLWHTSSNKATLSNRTTSWDELIQTITLTNLNIYKIWTTLMSRNHLKCLCISYKLFY